MAFRPRFGRRGSCNGPLLGGAFAFALCAPVFAQDEAAASASPTPLGPSLTALSLGVVAVLFIVLYFMQLSKLKKERERHQTESSGLSSRIRDLEAGVRQREAQRTELTRKAEDSGKRAEELAAQLQVTTERADAEGKNLGETRKALDDLRLHYQQLTNSDIFGLYRISLETSRLIECNDQFARNVGFQNREECLARYDVSKMIADDETKQRIDTILQKRGRVKDYEAPARRADGRKTWVRISAHRVESEGFLEGMLIDISAEREATEALHTTERLYRILAEHSTDVIFLLDQDRKISYLSPSVDRLLGYKPEDALQLGLQGLLTPTSLRTFQEAIKGEITAADTRTPHRFVLEFVHRNDSLVYAEVVMSVVYGLDGKPAGLQGVARDVTERRRAERAMRESEQRFRLLAENVPGVIYLRRQDRDAQLLYLNDWIKVIAGYAKEEFLEGRMKLADLIHPEDLTPISIQIKTSMLTREPFHLVYRLRNSAGDYRWVEEYGTGLFGSGEDGNLIEGFLSDITERRHAEGRLWESEERFRQLAENINGVFWLYDWDKRAYDYVSPAFDLIFGRRAAELLADPTVWEQSIHPDEREGAKAAFLHCAETGEPREYRILRPDDTVRSISDRCVPVRDRAGKIMRVAGFAEDITERRLAEQALQYRSRIERLLASISSRFLNPSYDDVDVEFRQALQTLGEFLAADRCFIIEVLEFDGKGRMSFDWCAPGIPSTRKERQSVDLAESGWYGRQLHDFRAVVVPDVESLPGEAAAQQQVWRGENTAALLAVPLIWKHKLFGVLGCACVARSRSWTVNDQHLMRTAGETFVTALQNRRADQQVKMSENRYRELFENANDMIFTTDLLGLLLTVNRAFLRALGYEREEVIGKSLENFVSEQHRERLRESHRMRLGGGGDTMTRNVIDFVTKKEETIPVEIASRIIYRGDDAVGVQGIARDMTEHQKFQKQLEELAQTDALTGANNRRHFTHLGETELARSKRYRRNITVLMMDIDHFKKINDTHGHDAGDKVLKRLTTMCVGSLRTNDIFGRLGGEEFAAVLPEADEPVAQMLAERLRLTLGNTEVPIGDKALRFTVSIGYALLKNQDETLHDLLNRADEALYQAKRMGRNRVVAG